ncbi:MAG: DeoR/GlpR family DNA-binding transcription regulator [Candidatus Anammoxibacter sp.]
MKKSQKDIDSRRFKMLMKLQDLREVRLTHLSDIFKISLATLRSDISFLEGRGLITHHHGVVEIIENKTIKKIYDSFDFRCSLHSKEKDAIASYILYDLKCIGNGYLIALDSGSSMFCLIREIINHNSLQVQIMTNNVAAVSYFITSGQLDGRILMCLTGGQLLPSRKCLIGKDAERGIPRVKIAFIGADVVSFESGIFSSRREEANIKMKYIESAELVILLADHSKLGFQKGSVGERVAYFKKDASGKLLLMPDKKGATGKRFTVVTDNNGQDINKPYIDKEIDFLQNMNIDIDSVLRFAPVDA